MALLVEARATLGELALDVAFEVGAGECLALVGPSGAGKSSVLRIVAGLLRPERGRVRCGDADWLEVGAGVDVAPEDRRCGYVFQDYALFEHLTAWQNVAFALRHDGVPRRARRAQAVALLDRFGLADHADDRPATLSGGERQRVAVARALARRPEVLLLDEPLSALDPRTRAAAQRELGGALAAAGVPALLVTHDFGEAAALGQRLGVMDAGRIVQLGSAAELAARPASAFVADLTGASVLRGHGAVLTDGLVEVALEGGGSIVGSAAPGLAVSPGPVAASIFPWEVGLEPAGTMPHGSARNRVPAQVASVTEIGDRVRIGLLLPEPLAAEVTRASAAALDLRPGTHVVASFKATATRVTPR